MGAKHPIVRKPPPLSDWTMRLAAELNRQTPGLDWQLHEANGPPGPHASKTVAICRIVLTDDGKSAGAFAFVGALTPEQAARQVMEDLFLGMQEAHYGDTWRRACDLFIHVPSTDAEWERRDQFMDEQGPWYWDWKAKQAAA